MNETIIARVAQTQRAGTSNYGNPAYLVTLMQKDGTISTHRTMSNAMVSYGINNPEYRDEPHEWHLTAAGRIKYARKLTQ